MGAGRYLAPPTREGPGRAAALASRPMPEPLDHPRARADRLPRRGGGARRARASRRGARGRRRSTGSTATRCDRPMRAGRLPGDARRFFGGGGRPAGAGERRRRPTRSWPSSASASRRISTPRSTPARSATSRRRRCRSRSRARCWRSGCNQGVDVWHAGPIGAFVEEEVTGWLRDLLRLRRRTAGASSRRGGVMANIMALTVARDVHLAHAARRRTARRAARDLEGVRVYASRPGPLLDRRARRHPGFPADTLRVVPSRRRLPPARPAGRRGDRGRSRGRARAARDRGRAPARRTPARSTTVRRSPTSPSARASGCTSTPRTAAPPGCPRARPRRLPGLERADSVTVDPHKWFFQAYDIGGLRRAPARGPAAHVPRRARVLPVAAARGRAAQLVPVLAGGNAPVPRAQALVLLEAPRHRRASRG